MIEGFNGASITNQASGSNYKESKFMVMKYSYETNTIIWAVTHQNHFARATSLLLWISHGKIYIGGAINTSDYSVDDTSDWQPYIISVNDAGNQYQAITLTDFCSQSTDENGVEVYCTIDHLF